jgi:hypothetical protein
MTKQTTPKTELSTPQTEFSDEQLDVVSGGDIVVVKRQEKSSTNLWSG